MNVLVVANFSDARCGFRNFAEQTVIALQRAGHWVVGWDGTYSVTYRRREAGQDPFLPPGAADYDVIHVIWHPATLNHYSGAVWPKTPVKSVWNGCPAAWCPFNAAMDVKWGVLGKEEGHRQLWYPVPDWVDVSDVAPAAEFTVGNSGIRMDGLAEIQEICVRRGWAMNFSDPTRWLSLEEEIRRLARSTVNVFWYSPDHDDRSGAVMMALAAKRPILCNDVPMMTHLRGQRDVYFAYHPAADLQAWLELVEADYRNQDLTIPDQTFEKYRWSRAVEELEKGWRSCR